MSFYPFKKRYALIQFNIFRYYHFSVCYYTSLRFDYRSTRYRFKTIFSHSSSCWRDIGNYICVPHWWSSFKSSTWLNQFEVENRIFCQMFFVKGLVLVRYKSNEGVFGTSPAGTGGGPLGEFVFYFGGFCREKMLACYHDTDDDKCAFRIQIAIYSLTKYETCKITWHY